jgi:hypothetical protein
MKYIIEFNQFGYLPMPMIEDADTNEKQENKDIIQQLNYEEIIKDFQKLIKDDFYKP